MADMGGKPEIWLMGLGENQGRAEIITAYLEGAGYCARQADIEDLAEGRPLGVVLDVSTFSADGWGILLRLKGSAVTRQIPVLPVYLSEDGKVGGVFPVSGFFLLPLDMEYLVKAMTVLGLLEDTEMWDLQALVVSRNGEEAVGKALEGLGFDVVKGYTGHEAIALATTGPTYMAVSSLMLPDMSAFELMERFRLFPHTKNLPFFVLLKDSMKEGERFAMSRQVEHLVRKKELSREEFLAYFRKR